MCKLTCPVCNPIARWRRRRFVTRVEREGHAAWAEMLGRQARAAQWEEKKQILDEVFGPNQRSRSYL